MVCCNCNKDVTTSTNSIDYRLRLMSEERDGKSGPVTDMLIQPQIDEDKYFCGLICLHYWLTKSLGKS